MSLSKKFLVFTVGVFLLIAGMCGYRVLNIPCFSVTPGFYEEPFGLEIRFRPGLTCYYTLDGSEPTQNSILYTGPIALSDASSAPNRYANIRETVVWAFPEVYEQCGREAEPVYTPDYLLDKCNIVRAVIYDGEVRVADLTGSYFVGFQDKPLYQDVSILSVITDPDNLFDYEKGIYVTGKVFDEYVAREFDPEIAALWWNANYRLSGHESERPAHIELWNASGISALSENCGIRIQGSSSRSLPSKSLSFYARKEYGGSEVFSEKLFGEGIQPHKFILSSGAGDERDKIRDYLGHKLLSSLNFATFLMKPCVLFLNGEYWGSYYITEAYNSAYISDHYDVPENEVIIYKNAKIKEGEENDVALYEEMEVFLCENDMSLPANYARAQELIDLDSCIDYYAAEIYIGNQDWPNNNKALWRTRNVHVTSLYRDGRWRWLLYDINSSSVFSPHRSGEDMIAWTLARDPIFQSLCKNPEFVARFVERLRYIADEVCAPENYGPILEEYQKTMPDLLDANCMRFWGNKMEETKALQGKELSAVAEATAFFAGRGAQIEGFIAQNFPEYS